MDDYQSNIGEICKDSGLRENIVFYKRLSKLKNLLFSPVMKAILDSAENNFHISLSLWLESFVFVMNLF